MKKGTKRALIFAGIGAGILYLISRTTNVIETAEETVAEAVEGLGAAARGRRKVPRMGARGVPVVRQPYQPYQPYRR